VAVPNIRGGGEFGEKWHKAGIQDKKQNTFNDFISATEWLIDQKYTEPNHIATIGYSNGGLVVTTVMTQRPELFKAVVAVRPLTDMLRFHKFPGGAYWTSEYGNPEKPKDHKYLLKYSPYHNIDNKEEYPAVLVVTSKEDDRVHPMHSYKLVARLKESNSKNIYLRVEEGAGHSGHASVSKLINELTDIYSFIFWQLGK
jgi:prolyl oligopeptidase